MKNGHIRAQTTLSIHHLKRIAKIRNYSILLTRARSIIKDEENKKFEIGPHDIFLVVTLICATVYHFIVVNDFFCKVIIKLNLGLLSKCV
jgi:hypothetical protein